MLGNSELGSFDLPAVTNRLDATLSANYYFPPFFIIKELMEEFQNTWNRLTETSIKQRTRPAQKDSHIPPVDPKLRVKTSFWEC